MKTLDEVLALLDEIDDARHGYPLPDVTPPEAIHCLVRALRYAVRRIGDDVGSGVVDLRAKRVLRLLTTP